MEEYINRKLTEEEIIHHINGNKTDNRIENLEITNHSKHSKFHFKDKPSKKILIKCNFCKKIKIMDYPKYKYKVKKGKDKFYCSKSCAVKDKVSNNLVGIKHNTNSGCFKYNEEIDEIIKSAHSEGLSGYQISKKYNLNRQTVYSHMRNLGLDLKVTDDIKKKRSEIKNIIEKELNNGLRPNEIIEKYNINESTFYRNYKKIKK